MRILQKVHPIEVKRAFVIAQKMRLSRKKGKRYLPKLERGEFLKKLQQIKQKASKLTEKQLNKFISKEYRKREIAYNNAQWYKAAASTREIGVWRRAGGLPARWTCCPLYKTARYVKRGLANNDKRIRARSKRAIPRIAEFSDIISKEKYLSPIVFEGGTGTKGRRWCKRLKGDIGDGCMRAIALAMAGHRTLYVYYGRPLNLLKKK